MELSNYTRHVQIEATPGSVFSALKIGMPNWWGDVDRGIGHLGDEFTIHFGKAYWSFAVVEIRDDKLIKLRCIDGYPELEREWIGTTLTWKLVASTQGTEVHFEHNGLTPAFKCYDVCAPTWDKVIGVSLKKYLEEGVGQPV